MEHRITKTERILSSFHLFMFCREVSYKEITNLMPFSEKTISRDIALLRQADIIRIHFSKKANAFVPLEGDSAVCDKPSPKLPDYRPQKLYLEKLIRLTTMMRKLDCDDPVGKYKALYPNLCDRTMQRDFKTLRNIGYRIIYQHEEDFMEEHPIGSYYCEFPYDTYSLTTFEWSF